MSEALAIPATTFVLKSIIERRVAAAYQGLPAPPVQVSPPPRPPQTPNNGQPQQQVEAPSLTLFLHHAGPNGSWRSMHDSAINSAGQRVAKKPLVLDLQYLLAAHGADLEREALLGIGMSALHRNAIVPRAMIAQILGAVAVPNPVEKLLDRLPQAQLADANHQPESITVSQLPVDIDVSTKLWSAFQSPIRPCALYQVTTVFLEVDEVFADSKPVETVRIAGRPEAEGNDSELVPDIMLRKEEP